MRQVSPDAPRNELERGNWIIYNEGPDSHCVAYWPYERRAFTHELSWVVSGPYYLKSDAHRALELFVAGCVAAVQLGRDGDDMGWLPDEGWRPDDEDDQTCNCAAADDPIPRYHLRDCPVYVHQDYVVSGKCTHGSRALGRVAGV